MAQRPIILDTNILLNNFFIKPNEDEYIVLPIQMIEELDNLKLKNGDLGFKARRAIRKIEEFVKAEQLSVEHSISKKYFPDFLENKNDNYIIACANKLKEYDPIVYSNDLSLILKMKSLNINCSRLNNKVDKIKTFKGYKTIECSQMDIEDFYQDGEISVDTNEIHENEFVILKSENSSAISKYSQGKLNRLIYANYKDFSLQGQKPKSKEQLFCLELLLDEDIDMVTITGRAGSGKTFLSCLYSFDGLTSGKYNKVVLSRPVQSLSKDIGFLPGTKEEKMASWVQPYFDNFNYIFKNAQNYLNTLIESKKVEIESLNYIRGRTFNNAVVIIDESQNLTYNEVKAIITRIGSGSKLILLGDIEQIDSNNLDYYNNGLYYAVEMFKDFEHSGHINLKRCERSRLADYAGKIM